MSEFRFRSVSDVEREYLSFELVNEKEEILLDIGASDTGQLQVVFGDSILGRFFDLKEIEEWIEIGKQLALADVAETDKYP